MNAICSAFTALLISMLGCSGPSVPESSVQWVDPNTIQQGSSLHDGLPDELLTRIKNVHQIFAEVDGTPLEKWLDDFKRDLDPEEDLKIWEDMAVPYNLFCEDKGLTLETRKEVFKVVLMRSMMSDADVLSRLDFKHISFDDANEIIGAYPSEAKPIEVIRQ